VIRRAPFCGGGTTLIAAETVGRVCLVLELDPDPAYCDVIVARWERFTGKSATLDGAGLSFDDLIMDGGRAVDINMISRNIILISGC